MIIQGFSATLAASAVVGSKQSVIAAQSRAAVNLVFILIILSSEVHGKTSGSVSIVRTSFYRSEAIVNEVWGIKRPDCLYLFIFCYFIGTPPERQIVLLHFNQVSAVKYIGSASGSIETEGDVTDVVVVWTGGDMPKSMADGDIRVQAQDVHLDTIAGATATSDAFRAAVLDACEQAAG